MIMECKDIYACLGWLWRACMTVVKRKRTRRKDIGVKPFLLVRFLFGNSVPYPNLANSVAICFWSSCAFCPATSAKSSPLDA